MDRSKITKVCTATLLICVCGFAFVDVFRGPKSSLLGFEESRQQQFDNFAVGASKSGLLATFGNPRSVSPQFCRAIERRKADMAPDELSQCVEFVTFSNGANWFYCFGIDESGTVVLKSQGHS